MKNTYNATMPSEHYDQADFACLQSSGIMNQVAEGPLMRFMLG